MRNPRPSLRTMALVCGIAAIGFLALRPPWTVEYGVNGRRRAQGHAWLWDPPASGMDPRVDWSVLGCEWVAFAAATAIVVIAARGRAPGRPDPS